MPGHRDVTPVEPLKNGLKCLECGLLLKDPVQTEEGDRLCRSCYEEIKSTGVSRGGIKLGGGQEEACYPDRAVGKEIQQLLVKCYINHGSGCPWQGKLKELESHNEDCKFKPQPCSNEGCTEIVAEAEINTHERNTCPYRRVFCQYCKKKTVAHQLQGHYEGECAEYPVQCERCSESVKKSLLDEHHDKHCPYVQCLCGEMVQRIDLGAHYDEPGALLRHMQPLLRHIQLLLRAVLTLSIYTGRSRSIRSQMPCLQRLSLSPPASLAGHTLSTHSVQWPPPTHPPGHGDHLESTAASTPPPHSNTPFQDGTNPHQLGSFIAVLPVEENTREESEGVSPTDPAQRVLSPTQYTPTTSFSSLPPHDLQTGIFPEPLTAQSQGERFSYVGLGFTGEFNG